MSEPAPRHSERIGAIPRVGAAAMRAAERATDRIRYVGGVALLTGQTARWVWLSLVRAGVKLGRDRLIAQMVRVGVRSIPIVCIVQIFIGIILALQMAPTLQQFGQLDKVATIIGIAVFRELGPLITAIVLSGFAGASITAEIGAMVEAEEIKAMRAHALNPIRFLVVPRVLATIVMLVVLAVLADVIGVIGGWIAATCILNLESSVYVETTKLALENKDFLSGLVKAGVFGALISSIACHEGLSVSGGAEGVGRATTATVVKSIVALIGTDCVFTAVFYTYGW